MVPQTIRNEYSTCRGPYSAAKVDNTLVRRYLAQLFVRPIPSAIWTNKYEDFGVPELLTNGGTGEGFLDNLGWAGAVGSAPGIVADLWVEGRWFCLPGLFALGWIYARLWRRAIQRRGPWISQYIIAVSLSLYLVMQTMEAVIFRFLLLSIPLWIVWSGELCRGPRLVPVRLRPREATHGRQRRGGAADGQSRVAVIGRLVSYHVPLRGGRDSCAFATARPDRAGSGEGVHAGLRFRHVRHRQLPIVTLLPGANWSNTSQWRLALLLWQRLSALAPSVVMVPGYYTLPALTAAVWGRLHRARTVLMSESTEADHARRPWKEAVKGALVAASFTTL